MYFKGKNVLVAGGTGMIGSYVSRLLVEQGASVRIASMDDPSRSNPETEMIHIDLTNYENCFRVCQDMEFVFNLLGVKASPLVTRTKPGSFLYATAIMELNMLEAARRAKVSGYVFTSSIGVYSPSPVLHENDVWKTFPSPNDWYSGWSKRFGELQVEAYRIEYGWDRIAIVRPSNVYGPLDNFDGENAMVVPSLIKRAVSGQNPLVVWGDGTAVRDFIFAEDVARGMLLVAEKMPTDPVNLGSGVGCRIGELVETIVSNLDHRPKVVWDNSKPQGDSIRLLDTSRARSLGYEPQVSLEQGIKLTMDWYKENGRTAGLRFDVLS